MDEQTDRRDETNVVSKSTSNNFKSKEARNNSAIHFCVWFQLADIKNTIMRYLSDKILYFRTGALFITVETQ